ncbi:hypothetical protein ANN_12400 [Periplaneta americana]|uniref:Transposable element Tc3 transposase n=1 Tax=Periplaneta americana TaxID=6978 RepID=A0ABQ8TIP8_PERAM|nr:hypothetical protein ANN_12400 [Periplaneta americana]
MLQNWLFPQLEDDSDDFIFMQDGAPPHFSNHVRRYLNDTISGRWIGRGGEDQLHHRIDGIDDSEMVFGEMRPRIRHRLPGIRFTAGENLGKTRPGNQPKRGSNPSPSATSDQQTNALPPKLRRWLVHSFVRWLIGAVKCRGRITTNENHQVVSVGDEHSCIADVARCEIEKLKLICKKRAREEVTLMPAVYREVFHEVSSLGYEFVTEIPNSVL